MDETDLIRPPRDVALDDLSQQVFAILAEHTAFPWPVLKAQAMRHGVAPQQLSPADLRKIVDDLVRGVQRFTSPETGAKVRADLEHLLDSLG